MNTEQTKILRKIQNIDRAITGLINTLIKSETGYTTHVELNNLRMTFLTVVNRILEESNNQLLLTEGVACERKDK